MKQQIIASPSTKKISDIYTRIKAKTLILQPPFQRKFVWNNKHKENFINTILLGYPTPEIYIAQSGIDIDKIEAVEVVVDGQQRLSTIVEYIDENTESKVYGQLVKKYIELSDEEKKFFLNYLLIIRDLGDITPEQIIEVFKRINSTQYSLNAIELHNAVYDGAFISTAKEILNNLNNYELPFFSESQIGRMEDLYFILLIMSTIEEGGYFAGDRYLEARISSFNNEYPNSESIQDNMLETFKFIQRLQLANDSIWLKKSCYFTMFIELYSTKEKLYGKESKVTQHLIELELKILKDKTADINANKFAKFYTYIFTGTNSRKARIERGAFFKNEIIDCTI